MNKSPGSYGPGIPWAVGQIETWDIPGLIDMGFCYEWTEELVGKFRDIP